MDTWTALPFLFPHNVSTASRFLLQEAANRRQDRFSRNAVIFLLKQKTLKQARLRQISYTGGMQITHPPAPPSNFKHRSSGRHGAEEEKSRAWRASGAVPRPPCSEIRAVAEITVFIVRFRAHRMLFAPSSVTRKDNGV